MISSTNVLAHEWIGRKVKVFSKQGVLLGEGKPVDETKEMFVFEFGGKEKKFQKRNCDFELLAEGKRYRVSGKRLAFRPEERLKQYARK